MGSEMCIRDRYNETTKVYEAKDAANDGLKDVQYSGYLPVNAMTSAVSLVSTLPNAPTLTADVSVINILGVEFYQEVNGTQYLFAQGNAMKIDTIF